MPNGKRNKAQHNSLSVKYNDLLEYPPLTLNQEKVYNAWDDDFNLVLTGSAGTGKTFIAMYLALEQVLDPDTDYQQLVIIRSMVPTREMGFMPGTKEEKEDVFTAPYKSIANELFGEAASWNKLLHGKEKIRFDSTSFIRGQTLDDAVIIVDDCLLYTSDAADEP